ncbi:MAG: hypothetical protein H7Y17_10170 [Chlorobia bacterium]|nr:hypothetical protein [Fimbriimonadaceae bacterium]
MLVKTKIILAIVSCAVLFMAMTLVWRNHEQETAATLQNGLRESQERLASSALTSNGALPEAFSISFSYWDEMVRAIEKPDKKWGDEAVGTALSQFATDATLMLSLQGESAYATSLPGKERLLTADFNLRELLPILKEKKTLHYFRQMGGEILEVCAATVHMSADAARKGTVHGYFICVKAVDKQFLASLEKSTSNEVRLVATSKVEASEGYGTVVKKLMGLDGRAVGYLAFTVPSPSITLLKDSSNRALWIFALFSTCIVSILFLALMVWINRPLDQLGQSLTSSDPAPLVKLNKAGNEFGALARQVTQSFEQKAQLESLLAERTEAQKALSLANETLERRVRERTQDLEDATAGLEIENAERRLVEVQLLHARNVAETASLAKSRFLANMSHEFRTPLNSVLGFADLLIVKLEDTPKLARYASNIREAGDRLTTMMENMLSLAEGSTQGEQNAEPFQVELLIREVVDTATRAANLKGVSFEIDINPDLPLVAAERTAIAQTLFALTTNAVKFSPADSKVRVIASVNDRKDRIQIALHDQGIGMTSGAIESLFEEFAQVDDSQERLFQGAGVGLAVAKKLVESQGGEILAQSDGPGKGCQFCITIPIFLPGQESLYQSSPAA